MSLVSRADLAHETAGALPDEFMAVVSLRRHRDDHGMLKDEGSVVIRSTGPLKPIVLHDAVCITHAVANEFRHLFTLREDNDGHLSVEADERCDQYQLKQVWVEVPWMDTMVAVLGVANESILLDILRAALTLVGAPLLVPYQILIGGVVVDENDLLPQRVNHFVVQRRSGT
jgi:hypothetical protein